MVNRFQVLVKALHSLQVNAAKQYPTFRKRKRLLCKKAKDYRCTKVLQLMKDAVEHSKAYPSKLLRFRMWRAMTLNSLQQRQTKADTFRAAKLSKRTVRKWRHKLMRRRRRGAKQQKCNSFRASVLLHKVLAGLLKAQADQRQLQLFREAKCKRKAFFALKELRAYEESKAINWHESTLVQRMFGSWMEALTNMKRLRQTEGHTLAGRGTRPLNNSSLP